MQPYRAAAKVHKGVVTVTGVQAPEGEIVDVIVIRGSDDNPALAFGGLVGPGNDDVGFTGALGINGPERFESYIFYTVDGRQADGDRQR